MPDKVSFDDSNELIRIKSVGDVPISEWQKSLEEVALLAAKFETNKLLIDSKEQSSTSSYTDIFEFVKSFPKDIKLALLVEDVRGRVPKSTEPKQRFIEAVGLVEQLDIRSFVDEAEAIEWLRN